MLAILMMMCLSKSQDDDIMMMCLSKSQDDDIMMMFLSKSQDDDIMRMCLSKSQADFMMMCRYSKGGVEHAWPEPLTSIGNVYKKTVDKAGVCHSSPLVGQSPPIGANISTNA